MAISGKKELIPNFNLKNIEKLNIFKSQKLQILANAHHFGLELEKSQLKMIINPNAMFTDEISSKSFEFYDFKSLKADTNFLITKKTKKEKEPVNLDMERWMPLRDRSYYKTKAQYLKAKKSGKVNKK